MANMVLREKTTLTPGLEFLKEQEICDGQLNVKDLHTDQKQKQNRKEGNLLVIHRVSFR